MALTEKLPDGGKKKLLALDGGGIRGLITLEFLAKMESLLRERTGAGEDFVLADYFDYVAGTSTGAIIASTILGRKVAEEPSVSKAAGRHSVAWGGRTENGTALPNGTYFVRVHTENRVTTRSVVLAR